MATMRCCARVSRAPATIFMARVIFCVDYVLTMRLRIPLSDGMGDYFFPSPLPNALANSSRAFLRVVSVSASSAFLVRTVS